MSEEVKLYDKQKYSVTIETTKKYMKYNCC